ncbi:transglutaminase-like domain-containing protein [Myxococcota bacterium]
MTFCGETAGDADPNEELSCGTAAGNGRAMSLFGGITFSARGRWFIAVLLLLVGLLFLLDQLDHKTPGDGTDERRTAERGETITPEEAIAGLLAAGVGLTEHELRLLRPQELGLELVPAPRAPTVDSSARFSRENRVNDTLSSYRYDLEPRIVAARRIPAPEFIWPPEPGTTAGSLQPRISVRPLTQPGGVTNYYFELDTSDRFTSPNSWRSPILHNCNQAPDVDNRSQVVFCLFRSADREVDSTLASVEPPFRVSAMRLPARWRDLSAVELEKTGLALSYGLSRDRAVREIFEYVSHIYMWATNTSYRHPHEVFLAGIGSCGFTNGLAGLFLDLAGVRSRVVGGFNPIVRTVVPGGGHAALEVLDTSGQGWTYYDPYFDVLLPGVSAAGLEHDAVASSIHVLAIRDTAARTGNDIPPDFPWGTTGEDLELSELFRFRQYGDHFGRTGGGLVPMTALVGSEDSLGADWPLLTPSQRYAATDLFDDSLRIFVRVRVVVTADLTAHWIGEKTDHREPDIRAASDWRITSFVVPVHSLLGIDTREEAQGSDHAR